jgi:hypothetical protein
MLSAAKSKEPAGRRRYEKQGGGDTCPPRPIFDMLRPAQALGNAAQTAAKARFS